MILKNETCVHQECTDVEKMVPAKAMESILAKDKINSNKIDYFVILKVI